MGKRIPDALEQAGYPVERHSAHFAPDSPDAEWIPVVGQHEDWILLTHDARQRYDPDALGAVMRSGVPLFIHVGHMTHQDLAVSFVLLAPRLIRFREKTDPPFIARVYRPEKRTEFRTVPGAIKLIHTLEEWKARTQVPPE